MSPAQMLDAIDAALARARAGGRIKRRQVVLELTAPRTLGVGGRFIRTDDNGTDVFGYTAKQCRAIRQVIERAAYADLAATAMAEEGR